MDKPRQYRSYDHRIREAIHESMDPDLFPELNIPRSTALDWIRKGPRKVVTHEVFDHDLTDLVQKIQNLRKLLAIADAKSELITKTTKILGFQLQYIRVPQSVQKEEIIKLVKAVASKIKLSVCLEIIGLSGARFHSWVRRQKKCQLEDAPSCPRVTPQQLTPFEIAKIKYYATSDEFAHFPVVALSWFGKKSGELYASAATWSKVIKQYGLRRPGKRIYPAKPKTGIRATKPGQIWHTDVSIIKLVDGTRCFIQAVLDNFSRYILAWQVSKDYGGLRSAELLRKAIVKSHELGLTLVPEVWMDSGSENVNQNIDELIDKNLIRRILAQIDVDESNSMIEALFLRTKHRYLITKKLDSFENLTGFVETYFNDSNDLIPHDALKGATPFEAITCSWNSGKIEKAALAARRERLSINRMLNCGACPA